MYFVDCQSFCLRTIDFRIRTRITDVFLRHAFYAHTASYLMRPRIAESRINE